MRENQLQFDYDIALSFAGEDRSLVERLAGDLTDRGVRVFYDAHETVELWGKDLYQHLQGVYRDRARYCVIFISSSYAAKTWTRHELKQAQARAIKEEREYILPVRLDDTEVPGVNATTGYIDLRKHTVDQLRDVILRKLWGEDSDDAELTWNGQYVEFRGAKVVSYWPEQLARAQRKITYTVEYPRIRYGDEKYWPGQEVESPCGDCAAAKGEYHDPGCDCEECPVCHGQALSCECGIT